VCVCTCVSGIYLFYIYYCIYCIDEMWLLQGGMNAGRLKLVNAAFQILDVTGKM